METKRNQILSPHYKIGNKSTPRSEEPMLLTFICFFLKRYSHDVYQHFSLSSFTVRNVYSGLNGNLLIIALLCQNFPWFRILLPLVNVLLQFLYVLSDIRSCYVWVTSEFISLNWRGLHLKLGHHRISFYSALVTRAFQLRKSQSNIFYTFFFLFSG